jgi:uncharacterized protein YdaT
MKTDYHVLPDGDGWKVQREEADRSSSTHDTQREAIERAREFAREQKVEVVIHRPNGQIRDSDSYGPDPNPPTDKKH